MFTSLETYLGMYASPEQSTMILAACHALVDAGYADHASVLEQELAIADNLPDDLVLGICNGYLIPLMSRQLSAFGVTVNNDAKLPILTSMFQAIMLLDNWGDTDAILDVVSLDLDPVELLADAMAITGAHSTEDYMAALESVSEDLISRLRDIAEKAADNNPSFTIPSPEMAAQYKQTLERVRLLAGLMRPEQYSLAREFLDEGGRLMMPISLLNQYFTRLTEITQPLECAHQILMLASTTQIETIHLANMTMRLLEQLHFDDLQVGGCARAINELVSKLPA